MSTRTRFGWAEVFPRDPVVAGSFGTWSFTYHAGIFGIDDGGRLLMAWKFISDLGEPQTTDDSAPNYTTVSTNADATLTLRWDGSQHGYRRPREKAIIVDVSRGAVSPEDLVTITYGDTSQGSPGAVAQTFCEQAMDMTFVVDPFGTGRGKELEVRPSLTIVNGPAHHLVAIAPSVVAPSEPCLLRVRADDYWGNPCLDFDASVTASVDGADYQLHPHHAIAGVYMTDEIRFVTAGVRTILVRSEDLQCESNPVVCSDASASFQPQWGDLHAQGEPDGVNDLQHFFTFGRDYAFAAFVGHQGNCFSTSQEKWAAVQESVRAFHNPGTFIPLLGYEYSATPSGGGDRNVYFLDEEGPLHRASHELVADKSDENTDRYPVDQLYSTFERELVRPDEEHPRVLMVPHVGGRPCNLEWHNESIEPVIEIASTWGEFEWVFRDALRRGYEIGIVAGSDDHTGRPGAALPASIESGIRGGLTCVYATTLTREGLFEALFARRCYGTNGPRMIVTFESEGHHMGQVVRCAQPPSFTIGVVGTDVIESVQLMRGNELIFSYPTEQPRAENAVRISWSGAQTRGRGRLTRWDGAATLSGGRIVEARGYAFDTPSEGITAQSDRAVAWRSTTAGDTDGVILTVEGSDDLEISVDMDRVQRAVTLGELRENPVIVDLGGESMRLVLEMAPIGAGEREVSLTFDEAELPSSRTPYWLKIDQIDGGKAWVSPIFVEPVAAGA